MHPASDLAAWTITNLPASQAADRGCPAVGLDSWVLRDDQRPQLGADLVADHDLGIGEQPR